MGALDLATLKQYEPVGCEECGAGDDLHRHKYNDSLLCSICLNQKLADASNEELNNDSFYEESPTYSELVSERNK